MKLNFRDLKQQKFTIEAEPSETIAQVKEKVSAEKGWDAAQQKLIYSGKILVDTNTVESYSIEEKGFIVCMVSKPKAAPAAPAAPTAATPSTPSASTSTPAPPDAPQPNPASAAVSNQPATPSPAGTATAAATGSSSTSPAPVSFNDPSALLVGQQGNEVMTQMEAMGFPRAQIDRAMRAAYFNPDRAVDYLINGIPENVQAEQRQAAAARANPEAGAGGASQGAVTGTAQAANPPSATTAGTAGATTTTTEEPVNLFEAAAQAGGRGGATGGAGSGAGTRGAGLGAGLAGAPANLDFLRNSPQFQQLRQLVQQQPTMLEPVLQQVADGNPQLAQMIGQNQEQFLQLLSEDIGGDAITGMGDTGPMPPNAVPISVTEEERDAIERLCRLGFPRDQVVQAYFACDKNEELAANFLFEQPDDEDS